MTALAALFLAALTLRPQIVGVAPLFPQVEDALGTSHAVVGLLGTIPVLCMGIFAPVGAILAGRIGTRRAMTIALTCIGLFGLARAVSPSAWLLVLLTVPVGMGMGIGNAISPIAIKERVPHRPATGTGVYTTGIQIGSTCSAALAVPLAGLLGGWRAAFITFSVVTCVILVVWLVMMRGESAHVRRATLPHFPLRSGRAWLLVAVFGSMGAAYYGLNAWIPDAYGERGWSEGHAGALLVAMNFTAIPSSFVIPWLSDRFGSRLRWMFVLSFGFFTGAVGLVAVPSFALGWSLIAGVSQGGMFALTMTVPLDLEHTPERVGGLVAMMLGLGYILAALSPFILGAVRDSTGTFDGPLWVVVGLTVSLAVWVGLLERSTRRHSAAAAQPG